MKEVVIKIIDCVPIVDSMPDDVVVVFIDYDVDGLDEYVDGLDRDDDGNLCSIRRIDKESAEVLKQIYNRFCK